MIEISQNAIYCHAKKEKTYQKNGHKLKLSHKFKKIQNFPKYPEICSKKVAKSTIKMSKKYSSMAIYGTHSLKYIL